MLADVDPLLARLEAAAFAVSLEVVEDVPAEDGGEDAPPEAKDGDALVPEAALLAPGVPPELALPDDVVVGAGVSVLLAVAAGEEAGEFAAPDVEGVLKTLDAGGTLGSAAAADVGGVVDAVVLGLDSAGAAETGGVGVSIFFSEHAASAAAIASAVTVYADRDVMSTPARRWQRAGCLRRLDAALRCKAYAGANDAE